MFAYLIDPARTVEWLESITLVRHRPPGPLRRGSIITKSRRTAIGLLTYTNRVTELDPARRIFAQRTVDSLIRGTWGRYTVVPDGTGSELRNEIQMRITGWGKLIAPLITRAAEQETRRGQERLKMILEAGR